jgi:acetolactate decarboxylase
MKTISCSLPDSLAAALQERMDADKETRDHIVARALSEYLATPLHTLFQVSTSAALVEGIYQGAVRVSRLLQHGDFGLGTFIDLDGEMVVLDGVCYQVSPTGAIAPVEGDRLIPYAVVTRFSSSYATPPRTFSSTRKRLVTPNVNAVGGISCMSPAAPFAETT